MMSSKSVNTSLVGMVCWGVRSGGSRLAGVGWYFGVSFLWCGFGMVVDGRWGVFLCSWWWVATVTIDLSCLGLGVMFNSSLVTFKVSLSNVRLSDSDEVTIGISISFLDGLVTFIVMGLGNIGNSAFISSGLGMSIIPDVALGRILSSFSFLASTGGASMMSGVSSSRALSSSSESVSVSGSISESELKRSLKISFLVL